MTSLSRRKRQITAPATPTIRHDARVARLAACSGSKRISTIIGLSLAVFLVFAGAAAWADAVPENGPPVIPVSYSTGSNGARLVWLPYRPLPGEVRQARSERRDELTRAEFQTPADATEAASDDPMSDPFGDRAAPQSKSAKLAVDDKAFQPKFMDPLTPPAESNAAAETVSRQGAPGTTIPPALVEQGLQDATGKQLEPQKLPTLEEELATAARGPDDCPTTFDFKPIGQLTTNITAKSGDFPRECPLKEGTFNPREWTPTTFTWKASGLCHKPLYFEEIQLERYGHSWGPYLQPVISHAHFFVTVPILPYLMGVNPPNECMYTLGYYRPGSCAPYMLDPLPISVRAGLWEAGAWTGAAFLLP